MAGIRSDHRPAVHGLPRRRVGSLRHLHAAGRQRSQLDESTGRVTTTFVENPEQPFSNLDPQIQQRRARADRQPACVRPGEDRNRASSLHGHCRRSRRSRQFVVDSNGKGGACPSLPFSLGQSAESHPTNRCARRRTSRSTSRVADGQQYLSRVSATLPAGLVGKIPAVPLCPEPQASLGTCSSASQIGTGHGHGRVRHEAHAVHRAGRTSPGRRTARPTA